MSVWVSQYAWGAEIMLHVNNMVIASFFGCMRECTTLAGVWHRVVASSWRERVSASFGGVDRIYPEV